MNWIPNLTRIQVEKRYIVGSSTCSTNEAMIIVGPVYMLWFLIFRFMRDDHWGIIMVDYIQIARYDMSRLEKG
jgi:hypothetical protein